MSINASQKTHLMIGGIIAFVMVFVVTVIGIRYRIDRAEQTNAAVEAEAIAAASREIDAAYEGKAMPIMPWSGQGPTAVWEGGAGGMSLCNGDYCWHGQGKNVSALSDDVSATIQPYNGLYPWSNGGPSAAWTNGVSPLSMVCNGEICWQWQQKTEGEGVWLEEGPAVKLSESAWWNRDVPFESESEPFGVRAYGLDQDWFPWSAGGPTAAWTDPIAEVTTVCNQEICWQWQTSESAEDRGRWLNDGEAVRLSESAVWNGVQPYRDKSSIFPWSDEGPTSGWTGKDSLITTICNQEICWRWQNAEGESGYWLDHGQPVLLKKILRGDSDTYSKTQSSELAVSANAVNCDEQSDACQRWQQTSSDEHVRTSYLRGILTENLGGFSFVDEGGMDVPIFINEAMLAITQAELEVDIVLAGSWTEVEAGEFLFLVSNVQSTGQQFAVRKPLYDDAHAPNNSQPSAPLISSVEPKREAWGIAITTGSGSLSYEMRYLARKLLSTGIFMTSLSAAKEYSEWAEILFNDKKLVTTGYDFGYGDGTSLFSYPLTYDLKEVASPDEAVLDSWRALADQAKSGEISQAFIYMVSHGIYIPYPAQGEEGTFVLLLQPGENEKGILTGQEMRSALAEFPSHFPVYVVIESCHSGNALLGQNTLYTSISDSIGKLSAELHVLVSALPEDLAAAREDTFTEYLTTQLYRQRLTLEGSVVEMVDHYLYQARGTYTAPLYRINDDYPYGEILNDWSSSQYSRLRLSRNYGEHAFWGSLRWANEPTSSGERMLRLGNPTDQEMTYVLGFIDDSGQAMDTSKVTVATGGYSDLPIGADLLSRLDHVRADQQNGEDRGVLFIQNTKEDGCGEISMDQNSLYQLQTVIGDKDKINLGFELHQSCTRDRDIFVSIYNDHILTTSSLVGVGLSIRELGPHLLPAAGGQIISELPLILEGTSNTVNDPYRLEIYDQNGKLQLSKSDMFANVILPKRYAADLAVYPSLPDQSNHVKSKIPYGPSEATYKVVNRLSSAVTLKKLSWAEEATTIAINEAKTTCVQIQLAQDESCEIVLMLAPIDSHFGYRDTLLLATDQDPTFFSIEVDHNLAYNAFTTSRTYQPIVGLPFHMDYLLQSNFPYPESSTIELWHWGLDGELNGPVKYIVETAAETTECQIESTTDRGNCDIASLFNMSRNLTRVRVIAEEKTPGRFTAGGLILPMYTQMTQTATVMNLSPIVETWTQEGYDFIVRSPTAKGTEGGSQTGSSVLVGSQVEVVHADSKGFDLHVTQQAGKALSVVSTPEKGRAKFSVFDIGEVLLRLTEAGSNAVVEIPLNVINTHGYTDTEFVQYGQSSLINTTYRGYEIMAYGSADTGDVRNRDIVVSMKRHNWSEGDKESLFVTYDPARWEVTDLMLDMRPVPNKQPCHLYNEYGYYYCDLSVPAGKLDSFLFSGTKFVAKPLTQSAPLLQFELRTGRIDSRDVLPITLYVGDDPLFGHQTNLYSLKAPFHQDGSLSVGDPVLIDLLPSEKLGPFQYTITGPDGKQVGGSGSTISTLKTGFMRIPFTVDQAGTWKLDLAGDPYEIVVEPVSSASARMTSPIDSNSTAITVIAKGTAADDDENGLLEKEDYPLMEVTVDDQSIGQVYVESSDFAEYPFQYNEVITPDQLKVKFINDYYRPDKRLDRNMVLDKVVLNQQTYEAEQAFSEGVYADGNCLPGFKGKELIACNGYFHFADGKGVAAGVVREWLNLFLGQDPADALVTSLSSQLHDGSLSLKQLLTSISGSSRFGQNGMTAEEYIRSLYEGVLHRAPDQAGYENWLSLLAADHLTRKQVMAAFVEAAEFDWYYQGYDFSEEVR